MFRFNPATGDLDSTYGRLGGISGRLGYVALENADYSGGRGRLAMLSYGWTVAANYCYRITPTRTITDVCVSRVNDSGEVDANFGTGSVGRVALLNESFNAYGVIAQTDNKVLVLGDCGGFANTINRGCVGRLNENGTLDTSFGASGSTPGIVSVPFSSESNDNGYFRNAIQQPDGKIVLTGRCTVGGPAGGRFCAARLNYNGTLDTSFGTGGKSIVNLIVVAQTLDAALQPDGKILVSGTCPNGNIELPCIARLDTNGQPDPGFDSDSGNANGVFALTELGNYASNRAMSLQQDGKIVLAGSCTVPV
ncbi:MAG: hypothetical protein ACRDAM_18930, partial [Casimicrobium sp.]